MPMDVHGTGRVAVRVRVLRDDERARAVVHRAMRKNARSKKRRDGWGSDDDADDEDDDGGTMLVMDAGDACSFDDSSFSHCDSRCFDDEFQDCWRSCSNFDLERWRDGSFPMWRWGRSRWLGGAEDCDVHPAVPAFRGCASSFCYDGSMKLHWHCWNEQHCSDECCWSGHWRKFDRSCSGSLHRRKCCLVRRCCAYRYC